MAGKMRLYTNRKDFRKKTTFPDDKEGVHYADYSNKWIVRVWKKVAGGRLQLCSLAAYNSKEDADLAYEQYQAQQSAQ